MHIIFKGGFVKATRMLFFAAFMALLAVPMVSAAESGDGAVSIVLKENGAQYLLYIPKGYRQVLESSPESAYFADVKRNLSASASVLGIFAGEETLRSLAEHGTPRTLKYFAVAVPKQAVQLKLSARDFADLKRTVQSQDGRDAMRRGVDKAQAQLGEKVNVRNLEVHDAPDQYTLTSMRITQSGGGELGVVTVFSIQDARLVTYYFYESLDAPDTLQALVREAGAYAQRYVDAGKATFESKSAPPAVRQGTGFTPKLPPPVVIKKQEGAGMRSIVEWIAIGAIVSVVVGVMQRLRAKKAARTGSAAQGKNAGGTPGA